MSNLEIHGQYRQCTQCGEWKMPGEGFCRMQGRFQSRCKECRNSNAKEKRKTPEGKRAERTWGARYRDKDREKYRRLSAASTKRNYAKNIPKVRARFAFGDACRKGIIQRPDTCSRCGTTAYIVGHHEDYSKPLDVVWLCRPCHDNRHMEIRNEQ